MRIVIPAKCAVRIFNPSDAPITVRGEGVRVAVDASEMGLNNTDTVEVRPNDDTDDQVLYLRR